jgi:membrane protein
VARPTHDSPPISEQIVHQAERELGDARVPLTSRMRLVELVEAIAHHVGPHHLPAFAGYLAYNAFLAIIPFLLLLVSVLRAVGASDLLSSLVNVLSASLPSASAQLLRDQVQAEVTSRLPEMWLLNALLAAGSLWACSSAFRALAAAINVMYETSDDRPWWVQVAQSVGLSLATAVLFLGLFALVQTASGTVAPLVNAPFPLIWNALTVIVLVGGAFVAFAATYALVPRVRRPVHAIVPGAACATIAWAIFSPVFAFVFNEFGRFLVDPLYGWFTGIFALLLYLYCASYILLLGAEVNRAIEAATGAGRA